MTLYVTKADGSRQPFQKDKIIRTCLRMNATLSEAQSIADKIEARIYDGIPTKEILKMIFRYMKKYRPAVKHQIDLREAIARLRPKPDFEIYVGLILKSLGYKTKHNLILNGKCVDHEIDVVAWKGSEILYVEVKHHFNPHTYTGLDVFLEVNSTFNDLKEGFRLGKQPYNFSKALVVCNTKVSEHGRRYAECRKIEHIGWKYPPGEALEDIIEKYKLYPITMLKELTPSVEALLADRGILTLKDLINKRPSDISKRVGIPTRQIKELQSKAVEILEGKGK